MSEYPNISKLIDMDGKSFISNINRMLNDDLKAKYDEYSVTYDYSIDSGGNGGVINAIVITPRQYQLLDGRLLLNGLTKLSA
jgi:hypothetical protein